MTLLPVDGPPRYILLQAMLILWQPHKKMAYMFIEITWRHKQWFGYSASRKYTYSQILRSYYVSLCLQHTQKQPFIYLLENVLLSSDSHSQSPCLVRHTNFGGCCINGSCVHCMVVMDQCSTTQFIAIGI